MKTLNSYINESNVPVELLFESVLEMDENTTLQDVYEKMFDKMFDSETNMINEGFFGKIGSWLKKQGDKAENLGKDADAKIDELTDAGKAAIETAKKKAGAAWDKVKGVYTNAVSAVDNAIKASKDTITNLAEKFKIKAQEIQVLVGSVLTNAISKGGELAKKAEEWLKDATKYPAEIAAFCTLVTAAKVCKVAGLDSSLIIDVLSAAGIQ